jgi:hypothetical protein
MSGTVHLGEWTRRGHHDLTGANCQNHPSPAWTPNKKPPHQLLNHLTNICNTCPVQAACAANALEDDLTGGVYAGIWVPNRAQRGQWQAARDELHRRTWGLTKAVRRP